MPEENSTPESAWLAASKAARARVEEEHAERRRRLAELDQRLGQADQQAAAEAASPWLNAGLRQQQPDHQPAPEPAPQHEQNAPAAPQDASRSHDVGRRDVAPTPVEAEERTRRLRSSQLRPTPASSSSSGAPKVTGNPFLPAPPAAEAGEEEGDLSPVMVSGPPRPTGAPAPADPVLRVPDRFDVRAVNREVAVQVVGLHGGAGASTLASLLGPAALDCGVGLSGLADPGLPVVLVARTNARGLNLVRRAASQWASGGLEDIRLIGVVLVDDAPALSKLLDRDVKSAEKALPHAWRLRWDDELRHSIDLPGEATGGRVRRIRKSLLDEARKAKASTTPATKGSSSTNFPRRGTA